MSFALVEAARILTEDGFEVFPYTTEDLVVAERLLDAGCEVLMPWGAPIGSGRGLNNPYGLRTLRAHFPDVPLVVDAGIGLPSHAAQAMELGYDAVLLNTAVAKAGDPARWRRLSPWRSRPGRQAFEAQTDGAARHGRTLDPGHRQGVPCHEARSASIRSSTVPTGSSACCRSASSSCSSASRIAARPRPRREIARAKRLCAAAGCDARRQRLLAPRDRGGLRLRPSRPGGSRRRRSRRHPQRRPEARRQHP